MGEVQPLTVRRSVTSPPAARRALTSTRTMTTREGGRSGTSPYAVKRPPPSTRTMTPLAQVGEAAPCPRPRGFAVLELLRHRLPRHAHQHVGPHGHEFLAELRLHL